MTAGELREDEARALAARALAGLERIRPGVGARVAVFCGTCPEFVAARDAITAGGWAMVPVNPKLTAPEVAHVLEHSGARVVLAEPALTDTARRAIAGRDATLLSLGDEGGAPSVFAANPAPARRIDPRAIGATVIYTSGTTGRPKGCVRTGRQETARADELIATYGIGEGDVHLVACPLAHSAPGIFARAARRAGARTVLLSRFRPRAFLEAVSAHGATLFFLVPTQYERLLALPEHERAAADLSRVRAAIVAGASIRTETKRALIAWLGEGRLWEFYGSSETGTVSVLRPEDQLARPGSVGIPPPGVRVRVQDEAGEPVAAGEVGEIHVRSPAVMSGYLDPDSGDAIPAETPDGFVTVGDLGTLDADGYLYLVDRKHDTIITGGVNVYPAEVEQALADHPRVAGAVVVGMPDPDWGQRVAAVVAVRDDDVNAGALRRFLRERLAPFKIPKQIALVAAGELPVGSSGKPLRRRAAEILAGST